MRRRKRRLSGSYHIFSDGADLLGMLRAVLNRALLCVLGEEMQGRLGSLQEQ